MINEEEILNETRWLEFKDQSSQNKKTKDFDVISKCSDCILGVIKWHPHWRAYCFFPTILFETVHSDRCSLQIGLFTLKLNEEHKIKLNDVKKRKEE